MRSEFGRAFRRPGRRGWYLRYRKDGVEVVKGGFASQRDAKTALSRIRAEISRAEAVGVRPVGRKTVAEFEREFLVYLRRKHKPTTFASDLTKWKGVILPAWGKAVLSDVTRAHVEAWLTQRATGTAAGNRRAVGRSTLNRDVSLLSLMFDLAVELRFAMENPCQGVRRAREEEREYPYLSDQDVARIVKHAPRDFAPLLELLAGSGLRLGEATALRWCDLHLTPSADSAGEIVVRKSKSGRPRKVPLRESLARVLDELNLERPAGDPATALVFPAVAASNRRALGRRFAAACSAAGLQPLRLHDLRHYFGTSLARRGVPIPDIAKLMGHQTLSVTLRYAKHAPQDAGARAIRMLDVALPEPAKATRQKRTESAPARGTKRGTKPGRAR